MSKRVLLITGIVFIILAIAGYFLASKFKPSQSGILVDTNPRSTVYINEVQVGNTPYQAERPASEITLKLVPEGSNSAFWSTKLSLTSGIVTVVRRDFTEGGSQSTGEVLSYEQISGSSASLTVVSSPDASQITIDGEVKGFTPLPLDLPTQGDHKIVVSQPGYADREINAKTRSGYKLTVVATLALLPKAEEASGSAIVLGESTQGDIKTKIEILDTPTGFLRVRANPTTSASEEGQVKPGETYDLLEESVKGDWFKIEYKKGSVGWIFSQYGKKS